MAVARIKPAIALTEAEERDAYPHPGRRISKYEMLNQEKPLPRLPVPVRGPSPRDLRRQPGTRIPCSPLHRPSQPPYPQLTSLLQTSSAVWNGAPMSTQDWRVTADDTSPPPPHHSPSLLTAEMVVAPQPLSRDCRASSFDRGASGPRSSKKINQLIGHDLDLLPVDPYTLHEYSSTYGGADYSEGASSSDSESGSEYEEGDEQCRLSLEDGLLPLLLEIDEESWLNRRDSWVPRTLKTERVPAPLNVGRRQGRLPSDRSASPCNSSEHSPTSHPPPGVNFCLSDELLPVRWNPAYGQFTDRRAANDCHRFAAELATSCGSDKSLPKPASSSSTLSKPQHHGERFKKAKTTGKLRQASTAAITRLWDNARTTTTTTTKDARKQTSSTASVPAFSPPPTAPPLRPLPPTPTAAPSLQESTRKKHCPARLSAVGVPLSLPSPNRYTLFPRPSTPPPPPPPPPPTMQLQLQRRQPAPVTQNSAFDCGSDNDDEAATDDDDDDDDDDEAGRGAAGRRWWRRSDEGDRRSSSERSAVQRLKRSEKEKDKLLPSGSDNDDNDDDDKERTSGSAGGVKGLFANARDLALLSPAERRRADLRKSIRVMRASEPLVAESRVPCETPSPNKSKVVKAKKTRQVRAHSHRSYFYSAGVFL